MGLCGGFRCGCGVTSTPATEGAINGELPSITVSGSGEPGDPFNLELNDAWATELVNELDDINTDLDAATAQLANLPLKVVHGRTAVTFDGAGAGTLSFGYTFGAAPTLVLTLEVATGTQRAVTITSRPDNSSAVLFGSSNDALAAGTLTVNWVAIGVPA